MTMEHRTRISCLVLAMIGALAAPAYASGYVNGGFGVSFGSSAAQGRANFAGALGWLPREPIGVEVDLGYAPSFFKNPGSFTEDRLVTVMGNVIVAGMDNGRGRGRRRAGLRPYVSGGFGLMGERVATAGAASSSNHLGVNLGAGVMAVSRESLGIRADLRYFQDLVGTSSGATTGINFGTFHFWRASLGVVVAF